MVSSVEKFKLIHRYPAARDFFSILFESVGIRVVNTGEEFSCYHRGTHIDFEELLDESRVDYTVELSIEQVDSLVELMSVETINDVRRYRILKTLFVPAIEASVNPFPCLKGVVASTPFGSNGLLRRLLHMEDILHVYIISPIQGEPDIGHTLVFANRSWHVAPGLHGAPGRVFRLTIDEALKFHRYSYNALKSNTMLGWLKFGRWYLRWRRRVSDRPMGIN